MIFIKDSVQGKQLNDELFNSVIAPNIQFINDRIEGKSIAVDVQSGDNEILYNDKGKKASQIAKSILRYKIRLSRDKFLLKTECPAMIIKSENIPAIAEALVEIEEAL